MCRIRLMTVGHKILGMVLTALGLTLPVVVAIGFFGGYTPQAWPYRRIIDQPGQAGRRTQSLFAPGVLRDEECV